jgi:hypothetical protein
LSRACQRSAARGDDRELVELERQNGRAVQGAPGRWPHALTGSGQSSLARLRRWALSN